MRQGIGPGGAVGVPADRRALVAGRQHGGGAGGGGAGAERGRPDRLPVCRAGPAATYRGSSWIVPPSPIEHNAITPFARRMKAASTVPVIATGRIVERPPNAMIERGDCDACGMTRAMITDPGMPGKAREGKPYMRCIGCNQGCIGHYHAGCRSPARSIPGQGSSGGWRPPPAEGTVVIVGAGPGGASAAAVEAAAHGDAVDARRARRATSAASCGSAGRAPAHHELWRRWRRERGAPARARRDRACGWARRPTPASWPRPTSSCSRPARGRSCPTGRRRADGARAVRARPRRRPGVRRRVDGDRQPGGRRRAGARGRLGRRLGGPRRGRGAGRARARGDAAPARRRAPATTLHQYQRNLYLARLDERGIAILHHTEVTGDAACATSSRAAAARSRRWRRSCYAQGREPEDELWARAGGTPGRVRAGDVLGPRSAEEATLEGVTALQAARAAVSEPGPAPAALGTARRPARALRRPRRARAGARRRPPRCASARRASTRIRETWTLAVFSAM